MAGSLFRSTPTIPVGSTAWKTILLVRRLWFASCTRCCWERWNGLVGVFPVKTCIVFQVEVQFAAAMPRKRWLDGYIWLRRQAAHPRIHKIEMGVFRDYGHLFRLTRAEDLDEGLIDLLHEAYIVGCEI